MIKNWKWYTPDLNVVFSLFGAAFVGLSLFSYDPTDPSLSSFSMKDVVTNYCGVVGSFMADALYSFFGLSAWILVGLFFRFAYLSWKQIEKGQVSRRVSNGLLLVVVAALFSLHVGTLNIYSMQFKAGGLVGLSIQALLVGLLNSTGSTLLLWTLFISLSISVFDFKFSQLKIADQPVFDWLFRSLQFVKTKLASVKMVFKKTEGKTKSGHLTEFNRMSLKDNSEDRFFFIEPQAPIQNTTVVPPKPKAKPKLKKVVAVKRNSEEWVLPELDLLADPPKTQNRIDEKEIKIKARLLVEKLEQFNVKGEIVDIRPGPAVTLFEFKPGIDVKLSKITELENDLSLALSSESIRIIAPIPGRDVVGIETANSKRDTVYLKDIIDSEEFWSEKMQLPIVLGRRANGDPHVVDLRTMPHILVAGSTGSGKSVFTVAAITALLFKHSPETLRLILIDPKQVDLSYFESIPHLLMPPILEPKKAVNGLKWAVREMEKRYRSLKNFGARKLEEFNEIVSELNEEQLQEHSEVNENMESDPAARGQQYYFEPLPLIVIVIEEFGDLMAVEKSNLEHQVVLLAQKARAAGIHLYLAMQSPRKDVVTGLIKTNIPGRVSFKVTNKMDSRIILDDSGAERLLATGDMLYLAPGVAKAERHHGPYLSNEEIAGVASFWTDQGEPEYDPGILRAIENSGAFGDNSAENGASEDGEYDEMYDLILSDVSRLKEVSASLLQRKFKIGYPRAARIVEIMERDGVVGPASGSKPRQVLVQQMR